MPGNEAADKLYNFFDQENFSQGQSNSQVARANNLWVGNQRHIGAALNSDTKNYDIQHSDLGRGNGKQPPQRVFYTNDAQLTRPAFTQGQSRNQELNLNGYIHEHQGIQKRQNHAESRANELSNQHKLASRGLSITEQQRRNASEHCPPAARSSERVETAEAPNSFDLDRQQLFMSNQPPGMSQPRPRQQQGFGDMQLWQQQVLFKQLQELQKQKQFQQLEHGHQNQLNQLSAFAKQGANDQLPAIVNGMPIHGSANYGWQNELTGGDPKVPNSSQMFMPGNTNWAQRAGYNQGIPDGMLSTEQGQILRSMGLVPQQLDQSVYAAQNASTRGAFNPYSHLQGISQDCSDTLNKPCANHLEKPVMQSFQGGQSALFSNQASMRDAASVSRQGIQGKGMFGHIPFQGMSPGVQPGNCMQENSVSGNAPVQDFQGREHQAGWSGNLHERGVSQVGSSQGLVSLDPTEKKILFSSDDNIWDALGGKGEPTGAGGYGDHMERVDHLSAFSSIQSGTWSALMQSAVAEASSSDTGLQDEWSGLHNRELSTVDQPIGQGDSRKPQSDWAASNMQNASSSTSRSFPLFEDGNMTQSGRNASNFQQSGTRNLREQRERLQHDTFETSQQSLKDSGKWLDRSPQQKTLIEGSHQVQPSMNSENAFQSAWNRQIQSENAVHATNAAPNVNSVQGSWVRQHGISPRNVNSQHGNNTVGWNNDNSLLASRDGTLKMNESGNRGQDFQRNDPKMGTHVERDHDGRIMMGNPFPNFMDGGGSHQVKRDASFVNSSNAVPNSSTIKATQEANQQALNSHHLNYRKHMTDSPLNHRDDGMGYDQNSSGSQVLEASIYNSDRGPGESYDKRRENSYQKEFSNDSYNSNQSQPTVSGGGFRENSWLSTSDSRHIPRANQNSQVGRKAPAHPRFQFHPMGIQEDLEAADNSKRVAYMQALSQQAFQESKGHEREYFGHPEFNSRASNCTSAMEKEHIPDFQVTEKGSASSDGSAGTFPPSKRTAQTCQNMLELFHNVDQSVEHGMSARFNSSDRDTASVTPEVEGSEASVARQWQNQPTASQGFGLRLAPPSQRPQHSSSIVNGPNSRQIDSKVEERSQMWSGPTSSGQSLPREISQRERWDNSSNISGQTGNESPQLNMQASFPAAVTPSLPYSRTQLQPQQMLRINEKVLNNPPANVSNDRLASQFRQTQGTYGKVAADQSVQLSMPGTTGRNSFVASPSVDTSQPESSSWSQVKITGQQFPVLESVPVSRPSPMSGRPQQGDFSTMLHHVWGNVSAQQHLTGGPHPKVPPNFKNSNLGGASTGAQQLEYDDSKKDGNDAEFGTCSTNAQRVGYGEEKTGKESSWKQMAAENVDPTSQKIGAFQGQESAMRNPADTKAIASSSLVAHPHRLEVDRGRFGKDPALVSQKENASFRSPVTSTRDIEAFGRSLRQANENYSLLHQVQAMKSMENNLDKRGGKRFKGADGDADVQQLDNRAGQQLLDGGSTATRDSLDNGSSATVQHTFSTGDGKMLSFSSERREDQNANTASQIVRGLAPSQDMVTFGRIDSHNHSRQLGVSSIRPETSHINPKMAPTWFDRYGTFRPEQILPTHDALSTVKPISQQFIFRKGVENLHTNSSNEPVGGVDASQDGNICHSTVTTMTHNEDLIHLQSLPSEVTDQTLAVVRPKKRKPEKLRLVPWHEEITCDFRRLQTISMAEQDWAQAANRLVEKMEDEAELTDDGQYMIRPRKRLVFTTQLMQQLLCPAPAEILSVKATSDYETVTYSISKSALGEACGLLSSSETDTHQPNENNESGKLKTSEMRRDSSFSKVVEDFIGRAKKLETDLLRLDKRASVMDIRVECQDLERFSVINRFAKFHGRGQPDTSETSSSSNAAAAMAQKTCPQRYVTAHAMPRNLPGGVHCLSL